MDRELLHDGIHLLTSTLPKCRICQAPATMQSRATVDYRCDQCPMKPWEFGAPLEELSYAELLRKVIKCTK